VLRLTRFARSSIGRTFSQFSNENMKTSPPIKNEMDDINDVFEQILLSEERISEEGYRQGFDRGVTEGNLEAYHLGKYFARFSRDATTMCNTRRDVLKLFRLPPRCRDRS
jgi:hypothetical protein